MPINQLAIIGIVSIAHHPIRELSASFRSYTRRKSVQIISLWLDKLGITILALMQGWTHGINNVIIVAAKAKAFGKEVLNAFEHSLLFRGSLGLIGMHRYYKRSLTDHFYKLCMSKKIYFHIWAKIIIRFSSVILHLG